MPCVHLAPLVRHLAARAVEVVPCASPYGPSPYAWWSAPCVFVDVPALRTVLGLQDALAYEERFDFAAGSEATWTCETHRVVLLAQHLRVADQSVVRVGP